MNKLWTPLADHTVLCLA